MKKAILLLLTVMLALASFSFALAEEERDTGFFGLLDDNDGNLSRISSAILVADGVVIAPLAWLPEDPDGLIVSDGRLQWKAKAVIPDETGSFAMVFFDPQDQSTRYSYWKFVPWGTRVPMKSCHVTGVDADGKTADYGVLESGEILWKGRSCFLLSLTETVPAGSPVLTEGGQLAGMVIAEWAEGINRVLVLPTDEIIVELSRAAMLLGNLPGWTDAPEGLTVTMDKNRVTVNWRNMELPEKAEGETLYMVLVDTGNSYLNCFPAETSTRTISLLLTPGRFYIIGPASSIGIPNSMPESYALISVPPAEKLTEYGFRPVVTTIAEAPEAGLKENEKPVPVTEVTEELLRSGRAYFYSHSVYEVPRIIEGKSLLVTLTAPDGVNYTYESSWIYMPEFNKEDIWYLSLKETGLTEGLDRNGYPAGIYRMDYYVDGDLADSFEFELK